MSTVAVTGGGGFIGRAVVNSLADTGTDLVLLGRHPVERDHSARFVELDVLRRDNEAALRESSASTLMHLAWDVTHGVYWEAELNDDWADATVAIATDFVRAGGTRMVVAGTCAERAQSLMGTRYAAAKRRTQQRLSDIEGLDVVWMRIFFPVGPHEDRRRLVPSLVSTVQRGEAFVVRQPSLVRDFSAVADVGRAFAAAANGTATGVYEVGSGVGSSLGDVALTIAEHLGRPDLVSFGEESEPDPLVADIGDLVGDFGCRAMISPHDALIDAVDWWKDRL
jgi:nucleoside-diphosphate-sugar epimerase